MRKLAGFLPLAGMLRAIEKRAAGFALFRRALALFSGGVSVGAYYPMGLVLGLLPCGLVYTALLASARAGMAAGR